MKRLTDVVIVGGGSSGWMTAAALNKYDYLNITLIESDVIPTVGVGESTTGHINNFMVHCGIEDKDFMPKCDATYKTSIKFVDFHPLYQYHYPFGQANTENGTYQHWFEARALRMKGTEPHTFAEYFVPMTTVVEQGKFIDKHKAIRPWNHRSETAYHFVATKFAEYLRDYKCDRTTHRIGTVKKVVKTSCGREIDHIIMDDGTEVRADLFIDCTGFKSLLIGEFANFQDYGDTLCNDRAWVGPIPYDEENIETEMKAYTTSTALKHGWVFETPTWGRMGTGYVHSSKHVDWEEAEIEFRDFLKSKYGDRIDDVTFRKLPFRHGVHDRTWVGNCLAIGLSYGFIEPLESTSLMTTHENLLKFCDILNRNDGYVVAFDRDMLNWLVADQQGGWRQFVEQHYWFTPRNDSEYWEQYSRYNTWDNRLTEVDNLWDETMRDMGYHKSKSTGDDGPPFITAGNGYTYASKRHLIDVNILEGNNPKAKEAELKFLVNNMIKAREAVIEAAKEMPTHYQFLKDNIYVH